MKSLKVLGVIPARLESTRLPKKLLRTIDGRPLIQFVYESVKKASLVDDVVVACDDQSLMDVVQSFGGQAILTSKEHQSGTERISEVASKIEADIYINIQGDEPLMTSENVNLLVEHFRDDQNFIVGTLAVKKTGEEFKNPNAVKVVFSKDGKALYFSRSPIPHFRDDENKTDFWKHLGIYAYRADFWKKFSTLSDSFLEQSEKLEQLRFLENGIDLKVIEVNDDSIGVDTEEDFKKVEEIIKKTALSS